MKLVLFDIDGTILVTNGAGKRAVHRIYTFNLADFRLLAPVSLRGKICVP